MSVILPKKYPSPFSFDEREILKKWSNLSKSKKLLSPFQRKVLYESGLFDEIFLYRYSQIRDVLDEFSELLDISEDDRDMSYKLWQKTIRNHYKLEVERGNSKFYTSYAYAFKYGNFGLEEDAKKALYWYKKAAQLNDQDAQYNIGMMYLVGEGVIESHDVAKDWFEKSSSLGHAESQYQLACMYLDENFGMLNEKLAYSLLKKASTPSKKNDLNPSNKAIVERGLCLKSGRGIKKNLKESVKYFEQASNIESFLDENPRAMFFLGLAYYEGAGVSVDNNLAFKNFKWAADIGYCDAEYYVARMLFYGEGIEQNYSAAIKYYKKTVKDETANKNFKIESYFKLGFCYLGEYGVKQNIKKALKYLNKANEYGHDEAAYWLGFYLFLCVEDEEDNQEVAKKAFAHLNKASKSNIKDSFYYLGKCYDNGIGTKQNFDKALICYKKSVLQINDAQSIINIADIYYFRKEIENIAEAFKWYKKAETMGMIEGKFRVAEIELSDEDYNKKELIKKFKEVINYKYDEDELDWSKEAKDYIEDLNSNNLQNIDHKKIEKKGNVFYPSIFQNIKNRQENFDLIEEEFDEDEIAKDTDLSKSKLRLVNNINSTVKSKFTLLELIEKGETAHIEFKQTLHYDVNGNAPAAPEGSIVKVVLAFFNGQKNGGELIVGVRDNSDIVGLESDFQAIAIIKKANTNKEKKDKAQLWLRDLLRENLKGYEDFVTKISIKFEKHDNKDILRICVPKSPKMPIYPSPVKKLKEHIISQALYIKDGNSIRVLEGAVRDRYVSEHFNN